MWSFAAVAHLLQGSTCQVFRDALLHTVVIMHYYLNELPINLMQSGHYSWTTDTNKAFSSTKLPLAGYFLFHM